LVDNSEIDLKLLTAPSEKIMYVFDEIDRDKVKKMSNEIQDNLCFITKDDEEILFFIKNASQASQQLTAIWTDSSSMVYSMNMLFSQVWAKSKNIHL
jgi:hypothetical protein